MNENVAPIHVEHIAKFKIISGTFDLISPKSVVNPLGTMNVSTQCFGILIDFIDKRFSLS